MAETAAERAEAASQALSEQEDYLRSLRYLTDDELLAQMRETLAREKMAMNAWLDSGDCFIIAGSGKVHLPSCPSMHQFVDRDAAWSVYFRYPERVRDWHGDDNAPAWPILRTRAQIEALPKYMACPLCAPDLDHADKRSGAKGWTYLAASSLKSKHFGTEFSLTDGTALGALTKISTEETMDGLVFSAVFAEAEAPITDPDTRLMYRTGTRALANSSKAS